MLKKGLRLRKKEDFNRVFRSGKPLFFNEIGCRYVLGKQKALRVGFSFSKKHIPRAVERNYLRRIFSHALFQLKDQWVPGVEIVFFTIKKPKKIDMPASVDILNTTLKYITKDKNQSV